MLRLFAHRSTALVVVVKIVIISVIDVDVAVLVESQLLQVLAH